MHSPQVVIPMGALTARLSPTTHFQAYGMGWFMRDYRGRKVIEHAGNVDGMTAQMGMLPEEKLGVVILSNMEATPLPQILLYKVFDAYLSGTTEVDLSAEHFKLAKEGEQQQAEEQKQLAAKRAINTKPSLPLERYAGAYTNDLYGEAIVSFDNGKLQIRFNSEVIGELEHWEDNTFRAAWRDPYLASYAGKTIITFSLNKAGESEAIEAENIGSFVRVGVSRKTDR